MKCACMTEGPSKKKTHVRRWRVEGGLGRYCANESGIRVKLMAWKVAGNKRRSDHKCADGGARIRTKHSKRKGAASKGVAIHVVDKPTFAP